MYVMMELLSFTQNHHRHCCAVLSTYDAREREKKVLQKRTATQSQLLIGYVFGLKISINHWNYQ